ncbi:hypothetical protein N7468_005293 [Penicillium chermesinum]|uniref:RING-type domain-containing protein n=1 Tax=Penicillium chermesinum TaxID=63820 RepID=A0A9W9NZ16_9EURO|nr:uncharacterized protein N7468_005293 [Penicillium chermesinum]KAJ5232337.1 hypothetical protein N7468_005293 [Penicillium chermesinum]KAJ6171994.1 hypothetical protein N7470_001061 [Penicillium chermesinum]
MADGSVAAAAAGLVNTLQGHVDDIRSILQCGICMRPLYEPFTLACGHTFCYSCLSSWFSGGRSKRTCPDCRAPVKQQPAPAYLVRAVVQMFTSRAELLDKEETTDDHRRCHQEETERLDKDKANEDPTNGGLFGGLFKKGPSLKPIIDVEDGVTRCPECSWELDSEMQCTACGYQEGDELSTDTSGSDLTDTDYDDSVFDADDYEDDPFDSQDADMLPLDSLGLMAASRLYGRPENRNTWQAFPSMSGQVPGIESFLAGFPAAFRPRPFLDTFDGEDEEEEEEEEEDDDYEVDSFIDDEENADMEEDIDGLDVESSSDRSTIVGSERNRQVPEVQYPTVQPARRPQANWDTPFPISDDEDSSEDDETTGYHDILEAEEDWNEDEDEGEDGTDDDEYDSEEPTRSHARRRVYVPDSISPAPEESESMDSSSPPRPRQPARANGGTTVQNAITIDDSDDEQPVGPVRRAGQRRHVRFSPY